MNKQPSSDACSLLLAALLHKAQQGDESARELLITSFKPFIGKIASEQCSRYLDWRNDDELSIALLAFNQAIDKFDLNKNTSFTSYAAMVIRHRLIDYFRQEEKHRHLLFSQVTETGDYLPGEKEAAEKNYQAKALQESRLEELMTFIKLLEEYGISLEDLTKVSPKHLDTKQNLAGIARALSQNGMLLQKMSSTKQLPIKELMQLTGASRKVLETGRRYIIALAIIFSFNLYHLQAFIHIPANQEKEGTQRWFS
ncbi:MAG: RNA polymerase sigma-I factor [Clostridia bacterium]|jgi:RNA polymerase sigma factor|nr:RNA polymerase sigma-I factor [Clostridia bacterium]